MKNGMKFLASYMLSAVMLISSMSCMAQVSTDVKIFHGGTILTVDEDFSEAEAIAIKGDKILATGTLDAMKNQFGKGAEMVDLEGKTMLPGFIDPHAHVIAYAPVRFIMENIGVSKYATTEEALGHLQKMIDEREKGEWVVACNWDPSVQDGPSALTFKELDAISTDHPIFVLNTSGHLAYVNSKAFEVAGIPADVANPSGAEYVRDEDGELTGTIKNNIAYGPILNSIPAFRNMDMTEALVALLNDFNKYGLTTTSELALGAVTQNIAEKDLLIAASQREDFTARVYGYPWYTISEKWDEAGTKMFDGNDLAKVVGFKLVADGSNQGYTGLQREDYFDPEQEGNRGIAYMSVEEMYKEAKSRAEQGWHLAIHGNGDAGIDNILTVMQMLKDDGIDVASLRPRIEHCSILHDEQIEKMKELGVLPSFLIGHVHYWGTTMRDKVFGPGKVQLLDRCKSAEDAGLIYSLQSDFGVTDPDMLKMIEIAVTRTTFKEPDFVLAPQERVSVESAIRSVTINAAYQLMSEDIIGSLEAGKYADFVILESDPRKVDPSTIADITVMETWLNGKPVYTAE